MLDLPRVKRKVGIQKYDSTLIMNSLIKETEICRLVAWIISEIITRKLFSMGLKILTAPLIREMVCMELLLWGLEKQRLQYTRIGFPKYDIDEILENESIIYTQIIVQHVIQENNAVDKLIGECR
jgi:anaerobic ribonucleoside-triphosphate reductase